MNSPNHEKQQQVLDNLVYISLPPGLENQIGDFPLRPDIMIPVETGLSADWDLKDLSWEMILAGMLKVLAFDPSNSKASYYRDFVRAVRPDIMDELSSSAILKAQNREWDLAEELFMAMIGLEPKNPKSILNLALLYDQRADGYASLANEALQKGYEEAAFSCYIRALQEKPELPEAHLYAGHFFLRQRSYGRAKKEFARYLEIGTDNEKKAEIREILAQLQGSSDREALFSEAFDFIRLGKEEEGLVKIEEFLDLQPETWNAWFLKGWALRRLGRYKEAYEAFSSARSRGGSGADLLNELAICAMETEKLDEAAHYLEEALHEDPSDIKVMSNLGICQIKRGMLEEAQELFLRVLDADENDPIALRYLELIEESL